MIFTIKYGDNDYAYTAKLAAEKMIQDLQDNLLSRNPSEYNNLFHCFEILLKENILPSLFNRYFFGAYYLRHPEFATRFMKSYWITPERREDGFDKYIKPYTTEELIAKQEYLTVEVDDFCFAENIPEWENSEMLVIDSEGNVYVV